MVREAALRRALDSARRCLRCCFWDLESFSSDSEEELLEEEEEEEDDDEVEELSSASPPARRAMVEAFFQLRRAVGERVPASMILLPASLLVSPGDDNDGERKLGE